MLSSEILNKNGAGKEYRITEFEGERSEIVVAGNIFQS